VRLIFAGTPRFAAAALEAIVAAGHEVPLVLTQPDRPAGRGLKTLHSDVKQVALAHGLTVAQPPTLKDEAAVAALAEVGAKTMVVAAYGLILPPKVLQLFPLGCLNIHASLLPRWRGAAPIQRAILAGDERTGISIMQMEAGLDTGPVLTEHVEPIRDDDTGATLLERLTRLGATSIVEALARLESGALAAIPQDDRLACYAAKISREDAVVDWSRPAVEVGRVIRTFDPAPGATGEIRSTVLKLFRARVASAGSRAEPGTVIEVGREFVRVSCGEGSALDVAELQRPGGKRLPAREFLAGFPIAAGERFAPRPPR